MAFPARTSLMVSKRTVLCPSDFTPCAFGTLPLSHMVMALMSAGEYRIPCPFTSLRTHIRPTIVRSSPVPLAVIVTEKRFPF